MPVRNRKGHKDGGQSGRQQAKGSSDTTRHVQKQPSTQAKEKPEKKNTPVISKNKSTDSLMHPLQLFICLLMVRICSAIMRGISDCDETFNYWEPIHYLLYGKGFQTWEYSPVYAIRSYAYLWFYALPFKAFSQYLQDNKYLVFYFIRCLLAIFSTLCEVYFYKGVTKQFGPLTSRSIIFILLISSGFFISTTAVLPNTLSMHMVFMVLGAWFLHHNRVAILAMGVSVLFGWPFSVFIFLPILWDLFSVKKNRFQVMKWIIIFGILLLGVLIGVDTYYYGKIVLAPMNIILYNVFTQHGANLYGVEPWYFYLLNLVLNFNILLVPCFTALPIMALSKLSKSKVKRNYVTSYYLITIVSLWLFLLVLSIQAHKEERFLFPAYPLICLAASFSFDITHKFLSTNYTKLFTSAWNGFFLVFSLLAFARSCALVRGFSSPVESFINLRKINLASRPDLPETINVCIGKEWYRYPSSFFLPDNRWKLQFIQSEFRGQLPQPYQEVPLATRIIPKNMNDKNLEETSRYISVKNCHFLMDSDRPQVTAREPRYSAMPNWKIIYSSPMLDVENSSRFYRSFWIPYFFNIKNKFINFNILENVDLESNRK